jgi:hypothetical protein
MSTLFVKLIQRFLRKSQKCQINLTKRVKDPFKKMDKIDHLWSIFEAAPPSSLT